MPRPIHIDITLRHPMFSSSSGSYSEPVCHFRGFVNENELAFHLDEFRKMADKLLLSLNPPSSPATD